MQDRQTTPKGAGEPALHSWDETKLRLLAERREVIGAIAVNTLGGSDSGESGQESDYASIDQIRDVEYSHREALSRRLHQLDDALERIVAGVYGRCSECGARIVDKRLASDPAVSLCVGCQAAFESRTSTPTL
jgi:RNA polymerase-binding transcription factor DksA